jgi:flagellum-specific ATP synthase
VKLETFYKRVENERFFRVFGRVKALRADAVRVQIPNVRVGSLCSIQSAAGHVPVEIVSLDPQGHVAMPLDQLGSVQLGDAVLLEEGSASVPVGDGLLGDVIDSLGVSYEGRKPQLLERVPLYGMTLNPLEREVIEEPLDLGVRAVNACLSCGKGQRQGIFAGSGVGKSVLLGMMARYTSADVVVIALLGERGREVREFLERDLGPEGRKKSVVVVETADKSAVRRVRGAFTATAIAEHFRSRGKNVLLMMDSLTRFAMAQREIGMAAGEPPTSKGYTPSVFALMARLVERAGNWGDRGSITGLYTVLVEGDDLEDPVADSARSLLDGHVVLSRRLANRGHYPAIDVLGSVSRVMDQVVKKDHAAASRRLKETLARFQENEDAIQYGMYVRGTDLKIDECIELEPRIRQFLRQDREENVNFFESRKALLEIVPG